jgi:hypothetical protein
MLPELPKQAVTTFAGRIGAPTEPLAHPTARRNRLPPHAHRPSTTLPARPEALGRCGASEPKWFYFEPRQLTRAWEGDPSIGQTTDVLDVIF